mgnify:CR=1 FL=1
MLFRSGGEERAIRTLGGADSLQQLRDTRIDYAWGGHIDITLPRTPDFVRGVMNLRGAVLPVIDLGARLGLGPAKTSPSSVVVVAQIGPAQVGLVVDAVCDILTVTEGLIQPAPDVGTEGSRLFVNGVITTDSGIVSLLSLDNVIPAETPMAA